jgi:hypothetical protein
MKVAQNHIPCRNLVSVALEDSGPDNKNVN